MEGPALTWRLRKYGRTLWSSAHARTKQGWLAVHAELRSAQSKPQQLSTDEHAATPRHWLDTLRVNTLRYAISTTK